MITLNGNKLDGYAFIRDNLEGIGSDELVDKIYQHLDGRDFSDVYDIQDEVFKLADIYSG